MFHTYTLALTKAIVHPQGLPQMLRAAVDPAYYAAERSGPLAPTYVRAAKAGVTGLMDRTTSPDVQALSPLQQRVAGAVVGGVGSGANSVANDMGNGKSAGDTAKDAALWAAIGSGAGAVASPAISSALWERAVPIAKVTMWDAAVKSGMAEKDAATFVNQAMGGLNYAAMGRSAGTQKLLRSVFQAPDWNEATIRTLGASIFGKDAVAAQSRNLVAKAVALPFAVMQALNLATTGHTTLENAPGHQLEVEVPLGNGQSSYQGLMPGNIQSYLSNVLTNTQTAKDAPSGVAKGTVGFAGNRLSYPFTALGRNLYGFPQKPGQGAARVLSEVEPVSVQQAQTAQQKGDSPLLAALLAGAGLNPKFAASGPASGAAPSSPSHFTPLGG